jgi:gliding motility-associated-like protein
MPAKPKLRYLLQAGKFLISIFKLTFIIGRCIQTKCLTFSPTMTKKLALSAFLCLGLISQLAAQRMFWVEAGPDRIRVGDLTPTSLSSSLFINGLNGPTDLAIDVGSDRLFYTDNFGEDILEASLTDGSFQSTVITTGGMVYFEDIAFSENDDAVFGAMNSEVSGVYRIPANNNDLGNETSLPLGGAGDDHYIGVAVDDGSELVHVVNDLNYILVTNFSGTGGSLINAPGSFVIDLVTVDRATGKVYFTAQNTSTFIYSIFSANPDNTALTQVVNLGTNQILSLAVYSPFGKIYYSEGNTIISRNLDGTAPTTLYSAGGGATIADIAIQGDFSPPFFTSLNVADNSTNVPTRSNFTMTFNENVFVSSTSGTADETSIRIIRTAGSVVESTIDRSAITPTGNTISFPANVIMPNTGHHVLIGSKVLVDQSQNSFFGITGNTAWNYTTVPGVTITTASATACNGTFTTLPDIVVTEAANSNFVAGGTIIFQFQAAGYTFQPGVGTVTFTAARNITSANITVTATAVTISYAVTGATASDALTISGIKVTTNNAANTPSNIIRNGGTGVIDGLVASTIVGSVTSASPPATPVISYPAGSSLCQGTGMGVIVASATGTSHKWYSDAGLTTEIVPLAGQNSATGSALSVNAAVPADYTRYVTQTVGCESLPATVTITIASPPTAAAAGADQSVCGTSATLAGNTPTIGTGLWTIVSGAGGAITTPTSPTSNFTGVAGTTYVLQWTISNSTCAPSSDQVSIILEQAPTTADAGPDQALCATTTTLAANTPTIGTGAWSIVSGTGGTIATTSSPTSIFNGTPGTTYVLRWTTSNGTCTPSTNDVTVTFTSPPTVSNAGTNQVVCGNSTALAANVPVSGTGMWSIVSGVGGVVTTPASATSNFTGTAGAIYVLQWTISNAPCAANSSTVSIQFDAAPSPAAAGADQDVCGTSTTLAATAPAIGTGSWSIVSGAGGSITTPTSATSVFTGTFGTTYVLAWTTTNGVCTPSVDNVTIRFFANPTTALAGATQTICGGSAVLAANTPAIGTGAWSVVSGSGGAIATPSSPTSNFTGVPGTTYVLRWSISNGTCTPSTSDVTIALVATPTAAAAGSDQIICTPAATLAGNTPAIGTGVWSIVTGSGGAISNTSSPTSSFTGTPGVTYALRWTTSNTGCPSSQDDVSIQFLVPPTTSNAGPDQNVCGVTTTLAGNNPSNGTGTWTIISGAGGTISTPASSTSSFSGVSGVTYILRWTIGRSGCTSSVDEVSVLFNALPSGNGNVAGITSLCPGVTGNYSITGIVNADTYNWEVPAGLELVSTSGASAEIKALSGSGGAVTVTGANNCGEGGSATINIAVLPVPDVSINIPSNVFIDEPTTFSYSSSGSIVSQSWTFENNGTSEDVEPIIAYTSSGDFSVSVEVIGDNECRNSDTQVVHVNDEAELANTSIKNVVTANGDELNRYLHIERIERFPGSEVIVIDRMGVEVFRKVSYLNDWDLTKNGNYLPAGNYVCVVKYNGKVYSRSVTILKGQ